MTDDPSFVDGIKAYVATALTVVVGLAWNNAFTDMFSRVEWMRRWGPFVYAFLITLIVYVVIRTFNVAEKKLHTTLHIRSG